MSNPVECVNGQWGFWTETWADFYEGTPKYASEAEAVAGLNRYCDFLNSRKCPICHAYPDAQIWSKTDKTLKRDEQHHHPDCPFYRKDKP